MCVQVAIKGKGGAVTYPDDGEDISTLSDSSNDADLQTVYLNIEGMTCNSCVNTIESTMSTKNGIKRITVHLDEKEGAFTFTPTETSAKSLADAIDDMGFEATIKKIVKVLSGEEVNNELEARTDKEDKVHISVLGMTCQSCVKTIKHALSAVSGVKGVEVSLEDKEAVINYNPTLTNPVALRDIIDDVGFEATLPDSQNLQQNVVISVEGMTCNSCVRTIEQKIGELDGVNSIAVSLKNKNAEILYSPSKIGAERLRIAIDDMGFEAKLIDDGVCMSDKDIRTAVIRVEGMTCMSCVKTIKGGMSIATGVEDIEVSLADKRAVIQYNPKLTNEESLSAQIEDMGFIASLSCKGKN